MPLLVPLLLLFAASGCAALIYEIVWFKLLEHVIGSTGISIGVLLATYMGGLFAGSLAFPRLVSARRHPLRVYAMIEAAIGVCGIAVIFGLPVFDTFYAEHAGSGFSGLIARSLLAALFLLPPTLLMGASLPAISRWVQSTQEGVATIGFLYGANTGGAFFGCLFAGFYLLPQTNMESATFFAAFFNFGAAGVSYWLASRTPYQAAEIAPVAADATPNALTDNSFVYTTIAASGAAALGAEVVWTRLLGLMIGATVYTFSIILAGFLLGIGIGGAGGSWIARKGWAPRWALAICQFALVLAICGTAIAIADVIPYLPINTALNVWKGFGIDVGRIFAAVILPAILWGASFPLALASAARPGEDSGRLAGNIYAANTAGAILGALGFSLWVIPTIGTHDGERALIVLSAVAGICMLPCLGRFKWAALVLAVAFGVAWLTPEVPWQVFAYGRELTIAVKDGKPLYVGEGRDASIAVSETSDGVRFFHISGKTEASSEPYDMRIQRMLGHLPALLHPHPRNVLVVGFGAGVTAGSLVIHPEIERIRICELEHLVPKANSVFFREENNDVGSNPRTEIVYDDARHYILTTKDSFDIITSDPIAPWVRGSANLYTTEYYEQCKRHLAPGGVMVQWVPFYETDAASVKNEIATFLRFFPDATLWSNDIDGEGYDSVIIGMNDSPTIDVDEIQHRLERPDYRAVVRSLSEIGLNSGLELLATYAGGGPDLQAYLGDAQITTDRNMRLEYLAGAGMRNHLAGAIYQEILKYRVWPQWLFRGSPQRLDLLRMLLHGGPQTAK